MRSVTSHIIGMFLAPIFFPYITYLLLKKVFTQATLPAIIFTIFCLCVALFISVSPELQETGKLTLKGLSNKLLGMLLMLALSVVGILPMYLLAILVGGLLGKEFGKLIGSGENLILGMYGISAIITSIFLIRK